MTRLRPDRRWRERGQTLVEFAIGATAFLVIVFGLFDVGLAVWNYNTLSGATREGARYAIVHGADSAEPSGPGSPHFTEPKSDAKVTEVVKRYAKGMNDARLTVESEWLDGANNVGRRVKVTSRYQYDPVLDFLGLVSFEIKSSSTMVITN